MQSRYENLAKPKFMISTPQKHGPPGNFLVVQWLGLKCFHCRGPVSVTGWRTKIPQVMWCDQKKKPQGALLTFSLTEWHHHPL